MPGVRSSESAAALSAAVLVALTLAVASHSAGTAVIARLDALAPRTFTAKWRGEFIQQAVARQPDIVSLYGSSELIVPMRNRAAEFFASRPTGFALSPVGDLGSPPLAILLRVASLGGGIRGRPIVISLSSTQFLSTGTPLSLEANYSPLQAGDLVFRSALSPELQRRVATRLVEYPVATTRDPIVHAGLGCLARACSRAMLGFLKPLWILRSAAMRVHDRVVSAREPPGPIALTRGPRRAFDWSALEAQSDSLWRTRSSNNPFGVEYSTWSQSRRRLLPQQGTRTDSAFVSDMEAAPRWGDLVLLLQALKELGARPLILTTPLKGPWYDFQGVSSGARGRFYEHFRRITAPFGFPARDFQAYDADPMFLSEPGSHLSFKGWLVYDRTIDEFVTGAR